MEEYEVEKIMDKRYKNGKIEYLIKWVGYPITECTWEPLCNLTNIKPMIKEFEESIYNDYSDESNTEYYLIGKKRENINNSPIEYEYYEGKVDENNKRSHKKIFYINNNYKSVYTIKKEDSQLLAVVLFEENGILKKITIPTQELRKVNPDILIDFYEERIKFS